MKQRGTRDTQRYVLPIYHPECGHTTAMGWNSGPVTEKDIEAALREPCAKCASKYRFEVKCSCGHTQEIFGNDPDVAREQMVEFYKSRPCMECEATVIKRADGHYFRVSRPKKKRRCRALPRGHEQEQRGGGTTP